MWNEEFKLSNVSNSVSDIEDYFQYIIKNHKTSTDDAPVKAYLNKIGKSITSKIKAGYYLKVLAPETMKSFKTTKSKITKNKNSGNDPHFEITQVIVIVHYNIDANESQQDLRVMRTFVPKKLFGQLLDISPTNFILLKTFNSEFSYIEVGLTDQNSKPLEIEDKINTTLVIDSCITYKEWHALQFSLEKKYL